jgi:uncharacterized membrane protein YiaA
MAIRNQFAHSTSNGVQQSPQEQPMSFAIYIVGVVIFIGGLIYGAVLLNIPEQWIAVLAIILLGLSVLVGVNQTRQKDPAA